MTAPGGVGETGLPHPCSRGWAASSSSGSAGRYLLRATQRQPVHAQDITVTLRTSGHDRVTEARAHHVDRSSEQAARPRVAGRVEHDVMAADERDGVIEMEKRLGMALHAVNVRVNASKAVAHGKRLRPADLLRSSKVPYDVAGPKPLAVAQRQLPHTGPKQQVGGKGPDRAATHYGYFHLGELLGPSARRAGCAWPRSCRRSRTRSPGCPQEIRRTFSARTESVRPRE